MKASWGCGVSVFDSSGEPAALPGDTGSDVPGSSGTEFEVGRTSSCDEGADIKKIPRMNLGSNMFQCCYCIRRDLGRFTSMLFFTSSRAALVDAGTGEVSTEEETWRCRRVRRAIITCRLVVLARVTSTPIDFGSEKRSRALREQVFDGRVYQFN